MIIMIDRLTENHLCDSAPQEDNEDQEGWGVKKVNCKNSHKNKNQKNNYNQEDGNNKEEYDEWRMLCQ